MWNLYVIIFTFIFELSFCLLQSPDVELIFNSNNNNNNNMSLEVEDMSVSRMSTSDEYPELQRDSSPSVKRYPELQRDNSPSGDKVARTRRFFNRLGST